MRSRNLHNFASPNLDPREEKAPLNVKHATAPKERKIAAHSASCE